MHNLSLSLTQEAPNLILYLLVLHHLPLMLLVLAVVFTRVELVKPVLEEEC
jgi:hypothetical protein